MLLDPCQPRVQDVEARLEAVLERLRLGLQELLLGPRHRPGGDEGHTRGDPAEDRDPRDHDRGADEATGERDRHMIPVAHRRERGQGPPQAVAPRPDPVARHAALRPPHTQAAEENDDDRHGRHHDRDAGQGGVGRRPSPRLHWFPRRRATSTGACQPPEVDAREAARAIDDRHIGGTTVIPASLPRPGPVG